MANCVFVVVLWPIKVDTKNLRLLRCEKSSCQDLPNCVNHTRFLSTTLPYLPRWSTIHPPSSNFIAIACFVRPLARVRRQHVNPAAGGSAGGPPAPLPSFDPPPPSYAAHIGNRSAPWHGQAGPGAHATNPPAPQPPAGGANSATPPPPSYDAYVANRSAPQYPGPGMYPAGPPAPLPHDTRAHGGHRPPDLRAQNANSPPNGGGKASATASAVTGAKLAWKWAAFLVGNLLAVVGIVYEIMELDVCFEENVADDDDPTADPEANTLFYLALVLVLGLVVDVFSAVSLSVIYRTPLDIKSAHKIPLEDTRNLRTRSRTRSMRSIINTLAPFLWGCVYSFGGTASVYYGLGTPCGGGAGGPGLKFYVIVSGFFLAFFGSCMIWLFGSMSRSVFCFGVDRSTQWTTTEEASVMMHKYVLKKSDIYDLGWQVHGAILSYYIGALSLTEAILTVVGFVLGDILAALGSFAPEEVQELVL